MVNRAVATAVEAINTPNSLIPFTIPPSFCAVRWRSADNGAECALELDAEEFKLACRYSEPLRVAHYPATIEQRQDSVLSVQQRIHLFVDPLHITTKRFSKGHNQRSVFEGVEAPRALERRNVSSLARAPNIADASVHSDVASTCGHSSPQRSASGSERRRRWCVTIASCQASSRARSDAASAVSVPKLAMAYGFISNHLVAAYTCRLL